MTSPEPTPTTTSAATTPSTTATTTSSRAAEPTAPGRPSDAANGALFDAIATEHATIYGYGLVSAHSTPDVNGLVSAAMAEHRDRREGAIAILKARSVDPPLPAAGYQLPIEVDNPTDAANLAVRMEEDAAVAWRAVLEQATDEQDRAFAVTALRQCAVAAARPSSRRGAHRSGGRLPVKRAAADYVRRPGRLSRRRGGADRRTSRRRPPSSCRR